MAQRQLSRMNRGISAFKDWIKNWDKKEEQYTQTLSAMFQLCPTGETLSQQLHSGRLKVAAWKVSMLPLSNASSHAFPQTFYIRNTTSVARLALISSSRATIAGTLSFVCCSSPRIPCPHFAAGYIFLHQNIIQNIRTFCSRIFKHGILEYSDLLF